MVTVTAVQCPKCKVTIYSRAHHDCHGCSCGACYIDGGFEYVRIGWDPDICHPLQFQIRVCATKQELYQDWNNRESKFGSIYPQISNKRKEKRNMNKKVVPALQEHGKRKKK